MPEGSSRRSRRERGNALLELALCLPLFVAVVYGTWGLAAVLRARWQLAALAHAAMREAAGGNAMMVPLLVPQYAASDPAALDAPSAYVEPALLLVDGIGPLVQLAPPWALELSLGARVRVSAVLPVTGVLRRWFPKGVPMALDNVVYPDPWTWPLGRLAAVIPLPAQ